MIKSNSDYGLKHNFKGLDNYFYAYNQRMYVKNYSQFLLGEALEEQAFAFKIKQLFEENKKYLETLFGPGKWEYTNLEISKLSLTIEELFFILLKVMICHQPPLDDILDSPYFIPDKTQQSEDIKLLYKYFWYRVKETIKKVEDKNEQRTRL